MPDTSKKTKLPQCVQASVTSSYLFDWNTIKDKIIEPEYFMGVDTYQKYYC